ncbi:MAG TPA: hypothetical protein VM493_08430 [Vicinamibacterales bacterium]|jgi:hypothetical protein|nr:hypothetical protein [Vicinamibacterales bacterium]
MPSNLSLDDALYAFDLPHEEAMEFLASKGYELTWRWDDMKGEAHRRAFTVAKVTKMSVLVTPCNGYGYCRDQYNVCREIVSISGTDTTFQLKRYLVGALGGTYCEGDAALDPLCHIKCPGSLPPRGPGDTCDAPSARPPVKEDIGYGTDKDENARGLRASHHHGSEQTTLSLDTEAVRPKD